jgi:pimeloyl-ACP methyl ester carboxylesterase
MSSQPHIGKVDFIVGPETYQTWYKVLGSLTEGGKTPLVLLHGGPGMTHHYMLLVFMYSQLRHVKSLTIFCRPHEVLFEKYG